MACTDVTEPFGGGDALLQFAHFRRQVRLVSHGGGHTAEQRGDLRTGLGEAEDVVDEQQRVRTLLVAEILGDGQSGQRHAQTRSWRLGHLAIDQCGLGLLTILGVDDAGLLELAAEVVAFARALAYAGEHRDAAVLRWRRC